MKNLIQLNYLIKNLDMTETLNVFKGTKIQLNRLKIPLKINKFKLKMLLLNIMLVFSIQATDFTIFSVKFGEIYFILFVVCFLITKSKINKIILSILVLFLFIVLITFMININTKFYIPTSGISILKEPFFITITRLVEIISCIGVVLYIMYVNKKYMDKNIEFKKFLEIFFYINTFFSIFFILIYLLHSNGFVESSIVYGVDNRLRGLFVEGGPFGLYYAFLFSLGYFLRINKLILLIFLIIIILAQSKAGMLFLLFIILLNFLYLKIRSLYFKYIGTILVLSIFSIGLANIADNYVQELQNVELLLQTRSNDSNFVQGRISGIFIGKEMIQNNPLFGIGFGNYSLVRNDPIYRGQFPPVKDWDLTGLGIFTLIVESGIVGFLLFSFIIFYLFRNVSHMGKTFVLIFYFILFFGVQIYFLYPWIALAIALTYKNLKISHETNNRL